jgi:hypothetical protein
MSTRPNRQLERAAIGPDVIRITVEGITALHEGKVFEIGLRPMNSSTGVVFRRIEESTDFGL